MWYTPAVDAPSREVLLTRRAPIDLRPGRRAAAALAAACAIAWPGATALADPAPAPTEADGDGEADVDTDPWGPLAPVGEPPADGYNGTYIGVDASLVAGVLAEAGFVAPPGLGVELNARVGLLMHLLDLTAGYRIVAYDLAVGPAEVPLQLRRHALSLGVRLHPLFVGFVGNTYMDVLLASLYVHLGGAIEINEHHGGPGASGAGVGAGIELGCGIDVPLGKPKGERSYWLGVRYLHTWQSDRLAGGAPIDDLDEHTFALTFGARWHNLQWARFPRPPELDNRRP